MEPIIEKVYRFFYEGSNEEIENMTSYLFNYYCSPLMLSKDTRSVEYNDKILPANCIKAGATEYVKRHNTKAIQEKYRLARIREAEEFEGKNISGWRILLMKYIDGEAITKQERAIVSKYVSRYASASEVSAYNDVRINGPIRKNKTIMERAYSICMEHGKLDEDLYKSICEELGCSVSSAKTYPRRYIMEFLSGDEQKAALKKYNEMRKDKKSKQLGLVTSLIDYSLTSDAFNLDELAIEFGLSREQLDKYVNMFKNEGNVNEKTRQLYYSFGKKFNLPEFEKIDELRHVVEIANEMYKEKGNYSTDAFLEYSYYVGLPINVGFELLKSTMELEDYLPLKVALTRMQIIKDNSNHLSADDVKSEIHYLNGTFDVDSIVKPETKDSIIGFFDRNKIPFDYGTYIVGLKRLINGSFNPTGDLTGEEIFSIPKVEKSIQKKYSDNGNK